MAGGAGGGGLGLAGLEGQLADRGRELLRQLLQDHLFARAAAEPRLARVTGPDGVCRTRSETGHGRALSGVSGPVVVSRIACRGPGAPNLHPADEQLGLPRGRHSPGLAKMAAAESAGGSLAAACVQVRQRTGCKLGTRQCQRLVRAAAADFEAYYACRPRPAPGPGQVLVLSPDAKGIRMRPGQLRPRAERARGSGTASPPCRAAARTPPPSPPPSAPPRPAWAGPAAPPRPGPRATSRPRHRTWTTPPPSRTD
ncbi:MAG TPA: hypothetical protein VFV73_45405, partial [Streptosporangiaceae bacterium]|nr:hypothetical protein [Streptosporangiaceae bacterium]